MANEAAEPPQVGGFVLSAPRRNRFKNHITFQISTVLQSVADSRKASSILASSSTYPRM
jgi:hypothetical protein